MKWVEKSLNELGSVGRGRSGHRPRDAEHLYGGPYPFIQTGDIKHAGLYLMKYEQTYSEAGLAQSKLWSAGTLCITIAANIAETSILGIDACFPDSVIGFVADAHKTDVRFVKYMFDARLKKRYQTLSQGVAQDNLSQEKLLSIRFPMPSDVAEQTKIADVLAAYDMQIGNNMRRVGLLEQSTRLLFKEWFVSRRYPGHEHDKIVDGVPEGWGRSTIQAVCQEFIDGDWLESKDQGGDSFRILQISNIGENAFVETDNYRYITDETFRRLNCSEVVPGDIIISRMPEPIGRAWLVTKKPWRMVTAVDVTIARPDISKIDALYFLHHLNSQPHIARCVAGATGATRPRVARRVMGALPILLPPRGLQDDFGSIALANNEMKDRLSKQLDKLANARDLLLPRLLDGRLAV